MSEHYEPERRHRCDRIHTSASEGMVVVCEFCGTTWQAHPSRYWNVFGVTWMREGWWHRRRRERRDPRPPLTIAEFNEQTEKRLREWLDNTPLPVGLAPADKEKKPK